MPNSLTNESSIRFSGSDMSIDGTRYVVQVDAHDADAWHALLDEFGDANFYQTWAHGAAKWGKSRLSHLVLYCADEPVAAAQLAIVHAPVLGAGVAHARFGPLWQRNGRPREPGHYRAMLLALRREYCVRRGLLLRIKPWVSAAEQEELDALHFAAGFDRRGGPSSYETFVMDLSIGIDAIHTGLSRSWRRDLRRAARLPFTTRCTQEPEGLQQFMNVYEQMQAHRPFDDSTNVDLLTTMAAALPQHQRPWVMLCTEGEKPVAAVVFSLLGERAFALHGASTHEGMQNGASYVVNWAVVEWLERNGRCRWYDLVGGVTNPGIRHFKAGLARGCGGIVRMHDYDAGGSFLTRQIVRVGEWLRPPPRGRSGKRLSPRPPARTSSNRRRCVVSPDWRPSPCRAPW